MECWEAILPQTVRHPALTVDLKGILSYYQSRYCGAMYSGCGGGYLFCAFPTEPVPQRLPDQTLALQNDEWRDNRASWSKSDLGDAMRHALALLVFLLPPLAVLTRRKSTSRRRAVTRSGTAVMLISAGRLAVRFHGPRANSALQRDGKTFGKAEWVGPGKAPFPSEKTPDGSPFGPGVMLKSGPGENRILLREGSPFVFVTAGPTTGQATMPGPPGSACWRLRSPPRRTPRG